MRNYHRFDRNTFQQILDHYLVFIDGRGPPWMAQAVKDEEVRLVLRKKGYRVLELSYDSYSEKKRDQPYVQIIDSLRT